MQDPIHLQAEAKEAVSHNIQRYVFGWTDDVPADIQRLSFEEQSSIFANIFERDLSNSSLQLEKVFPLMQEWPSYLAKPFIEETLRSYRSDAVSASLAMSNWSEEDMRKLKLIK